MMRFLLIVLLTSIYLFADFNQADRLNAIALEEAQISFEREDFAKSYQYFKRVERTRENEPAIEFYLGRCAFEMGDYETAEKHYKNVLTLKPNHSTANYELARVHLKYARDEEEKAKDLFAMINPKELPEDSRNLVSKYSGFSKIPLSHKFKGEIGFFGFSQSKAPALPQLLDSRLSLPDPSDADKSHLESRKGYLATIDLSHQYQESGECGFKWINRIEADYIDYSSLDDAEISRVFASTGLGFRIQDRFWFIPQYFISQDRYFDGARSFNRNGWSIRVEANPQTNIDAFGALNFYSQTYKDEENIKTKGLQGELGFKVYVDIHYFEAGLLVDHTYDSKAYRDDELGLYTQNRFRMLWNHQYTPKVATKFGLEYFDMDFKGANDDEKKARATAGLFNLDISITPSVNLDFLVKMANVHADQTNGSYSDSLVRAGVKYRF